MIETPFQVTISVWGRFHGFHLARELSSRRALAQLITSYPRFEARKYGIPREAITGFPWLEAMARAWARGPRSFQESWNPQLCFSTLYDYFASRALRGEAEILVAWSGFSLKTLQRAKALGMLTVLERGSTHMAEQQRLLREEYARFGLAINETHPGIIEKELQEYDEADIICVPSKFARDSFLRRGFAPERILQIPYGTDLERFRPGPREDQIFRVIYCGALSLQKGVPYLLKAFRALDLPDSELWLIGSVLPELRPLLEKYSHPRVKVWGVRPQAELSRIFSQGSLFCLPSIQDGFGMVLTQAMACGLPILCTTNTGGPDLITENREGFVVPIRDAEALQEKILWCYEHRDACREMGQAAAARVSKGFGWDNYGSAILSSYASALAQPGSDKIAIK